MIAILTTNATSFLSQKRQQLVLFYVGYVT